jgi:ankyrin repeat protein
MNGQDKVVEYFVKTTKIPVDLQDKAGDSPLMLAACNGKVNTVRLLLSLGAKPTLRNRNNRTAIGIKYLFNINI